MSGCCCSRWKLSNTLAFTGKKRSANLQHSSIVSKHCIYLYLCTKKLTEAKDAAAFGQKGIQNKLKALTCSIYVFQCCTSAHLHGKNSTYTHDDSRICYAVYAMSSGMCYCLVTLQRKNSMCYPVQSLAFLQKTIQTSNTQNITTKKTIGFLVPLFQKCCEEKGETLWEQATSAAFWDSKLLPNKHQNIQVVHFMQCCPFAHGFHYMSGFWMGRYFSFRLAFLCLPWNILFSISICEN